MIGLRRQIKRHWYYVSMIYWVLSPAAASREKSLKELNRMLEEDAENILKFMAANGLVANPSKTAFLLIKIHKVSPCKLRHEFTIIYLKKSLH